MAGFRSVGTGRPPRPGNGDAARLVVADPSPGPSGRCGRCVPVGTGWYPAAARPAPRKTCRPPGHRPRSPSQFALRGSGGQGPRHPRRDLRALPIPRALGAPAGEVPCAPRIPGKSRARSAVRGSPARTSARLKGLRDSSHRRHQLPPPPSIFSVFPSFCPSLHLLLHPLLHLLELPGASCGLPGW
jgi:hypothetical protein